MINCKICGYPLHHAPSIGDICPCCFNEYGFDDELTKEDAIDLFCAGNPELLNYFVPDVLSIDDDDFMPSSMSQTLLRLSWIKKGCRCHEKGDQKLSSETVQKQLQLINCDYNTLLSISNKLP